jgi:hypothetical protein
VILALFLSSRKRIRSKQSQARLRYDSMKETATLLAYSDKQQRAALTFHGSAALKNLLRFDANRLNLTVLAKSITILLIR